MTVYEVQRQRHNKQINYTQDSSKKEELPWVGYAYNKKKLLNNKRKFLESQKY